MSVISSHIHDKCVWDATIIEKIVHYEYDCFVSRSNSDPDIYYYNQMQDHCFSPFYSVGSCQKHSWFFAKI